MHFIDVTDSLTSGCITMNTPDPPPIPVALRATANTSSNGMIGIIDMIMKDTYWKDYVKNKVQEELNYLAWMRTDAMDSSSYPAPFPESTVFPMGHRPDSIHLSRSIALTKSTNGSEGIISEADLWEKSVSKWSTNLDQTFKTPGLGMTWVNANNNYARWGRDTEPWMLCGSPIQVEPFIVNMGLKIERMDRDDMQKLQMPDVPVDATTNRVNEMTIVNKGIEPSATVRCSPMNHATIAPCMDITSDQAIPTKKLKETKGRKRKRTGMRHRSEGKKGREPCARLSVGDSRVLKDCAFTVP